MDEAYLIHEYAVHAVVSGIICLYTIYYWMYARSPPTLYGHSSELVNFFRTHIPFLGEVYSPFIFGFTGRVQTILRPIFHRTDKCNYEKEIFVLPDGGEMTLSWSNPAELGSDSPIVVLLPGLTGCGCCSYISSLVKGINSRGYRCVVSNNRGTCRHKLKTPRTYCAAYTEDIALAFDHIRTLYPKAPMVAVGISLGALLVFNYLAEQGKSNAGAGSASCPLMAAMCVCMPWDLVQTSEKLEKSADWFLFNLPLTCGLRKMITHNADVLSQEFDVPKVLQSRSVKEIDQHLIVSMFGFDSVEDYYTQASPVTKIQDVQIPVLCLNAADDPFVPFASLPLKSVKESSGKVVIALTRRGGHIGFLDGLSPTGPNLLDRAVPQFVSAVIRNQEEFTALGSNDDTQVPRTLS